MSRKPRKPKAGSVSKRFDNLSAIQRQIKRERQRHNNKMMGIAVQRDALRGHSDPVLRDTILGRLRHDEVEERQRHKARIEELERRAREVWK